MEMRNVSPNSYRPTYRVKILPGSSRSTGNDFLAIELFMHFLIIFSFANFQHEMVHWNWNKSKSGI